MKYDENLLKHLNNRLKVYGYKIIESGLVKINVFYYLELKIYSSASKRDYYCKSLLLTKSTLKSLDYCNKIANNLLFKLIRSDKNASNEN